MGLGNRAREYEKPAAYSFFLVQRALQLGACSQEAEGQAGTASSADFICEKTSCISNQPFPSLFLSFGSQCWQRTVLYKHLSESFAQKLTVYAPHLVQRALVRGACSQEAEGRAGKFSHSRRSCQHTPPLLVQRALVLGACRQEAEGRAGKASSLDSVIRITDVIHAQSNSCETGPRPRRRGNAYFQRTNPCILCDVYSM